MEQNPTQTTARTSPVLEPVQPASRQVIRDAGRRYVLSCVNQSVVRKMPRRVRRELARQYERKQWKNRPANMRSITTKEPEEHGAAQLSTALKNAVTTESTTDTESAVYLRENG